MLAKRQKLFASSSWELIGKQEMPCWRPGKRVRRYFTTEKVSKDGVSEEAPTRHSYWQQLHPRLPLLSAERTVQPVRARRVPGSFFSMGNTVRDDYVMDEMRCGN